MKPFKRMSSVSSAPYTHTTHNNKSNVMNHNRLVNQCFEKADINGDGVLDFEEFKSGFKQQ